MQLPSYWHCWWLYRDRVGSKDDVLGPGRSHQWRGVCRSHPDQPFLHGHLGVPLADAEVVRALGGDPTHAVLLGFLDCETHAEKIQMELVELVYLHQIKSTLYWTPSCCWDKPKAKPTS